MRHTIKSGRQHLKKSRVNTYSAIREWMKWGIPAFRMYSLSRHYSGPTFNSQAVPEEKCLTLADGTDRLSQNSGNNLPMFTGIKNTWGGQNIEEYTKYWHPGNKENCSPNTGKTQRLRQKKTPYRIQDGGTRPTEIINHQYKIPHTSYQPSIDRKSTCNQDEGMRYSTQKCVFTDKIKMRNTYCIKKIRIKQSSYWDLITYCIK